MSERKNDRIVMIIDNGWIMCGDRVKDASTGRFSLHNCVWVFGWQSIGLHGVLRDPSNSKVTLHPFPDIEVPMATEIFSIPVEDGWGLNACK